MKRTFARQTILIDGWEGEYECPDCGASITVEDGGPVHVPGIEIRCPITRKQVVLHDAEDGDEYECPHCGAEIVAGDGDAEHLES